VQARLDRFGHSQSLSEREEELTRPFFERVALPGIARAGSTTRRLLPSTIATDLETRLTHASEPLSLHAFTLIQMASIGLGIVIITTGIVLDPHKLILTGVLAGAVGVAAMPLVWLGQAAASRRNRIHRELPDAADLIVTMVEAGMSIDAALARVAEEMDGPLADELRFTMRETTLGRSRKDALLGLVDHTDVPDLRAFVQAIGHAQATGVPLGQVLRTAVDGDPAQEAATGGRSGAEGARQGPCRDDLLHHAGPDDDLAGPGHPARVEADLGTGSRRRRWRSASPIV